VAIKFIVNEDFEKEKLITIRRVSHQIIDGKEDKIC